MSSLPLPLAAFIAGLMSFLSPCVLPLVPGYVSVISGSTLQELRERSGRSTHFVMLNSAVFIVGFSIVFVALGALASSIGQVLGHNLTLFNRIAGMIIIVFGLHQTGLVPIKLLYGDKRFHRIASAGPMSGAFLTGLSFGFGWTPCVGPLLASILGLAASESTFAKGVGLLGIYSLGLGVPFFLTSLGLERFLNLYAHFRPHLRTVELGSGIFLIVTGGLVLTRQFAVINSWMSRFSIVQAFAERFL